MGRKLSLALVHFRGRFDELASSARGSCVRGLRCHGSRSAREGDRARRDRVSAVDGVVQRGGERGFVPARRRRARRAHGGNPHSRRSSRVEGPARGGAGEPSGPRKVPHDRFPFLAVPLKERGTSDVIGGHLHGLAGCLVLLGPEDAPGRRVAAVRGAGRCGLHGARGVRRIVAPGRWGGTRERRDEARDQA